MTVETQLNSITYPGDDVKVDFIFQFKTYDTDSILVFEDQTVTTKTVVVTLNVDQDVSPGGSVNVTPAIATGIAVTVQRIVPIDQQRAYPFGGSFPSNSHERGLDKLTFINQQQEEEIGRTIKAAIGSDPTIDYTFPGYDAGKAFIWNDADKTIINSNDNFNDIVSDAQASAAAAQASATAADTSFKEFDKRYLGEFAIDPTLDNEGNALIKGAIYSVTSTGLFREYSGTVWRGTVPSDAASVVYSNGASKIPATEVQAAIDYLANKRAGETAIMHDVKGESDSGGTSLTAAYKVRDLNVIESNPDNIILALAANLFKLALGDYSIRADAPGYSVLSHRLQLYNETLASVVIDNTSGAYAAISSQSHAFIDALFTVTDISHEYSIRHYTEMAQSGNGLGRPTSISGLGSIYAHVVLTRLKIG